MWCFEACSPNGLSVLHEVLDVPWDGWERWGDIERFPPTLGGLKARTVAVGTRSCSGTVHGCRLRRHPKAIGARYTGLVGHLGFLPSEVLHVVFRGMQSQRVVGVTRGF